VLDLSELARAPKTPRQVQGGTVGIESLPEEMLLMK